MSSTTTQGPAISSTVGSMGSSTIKTPGKTTASTVAPIKTTTTTSGLTPIDPNVDFFMSQRCGNADPDSGLGFWEWCSTEERRSQVYETKCTNIEGSAAVTCDARLQFLDSTHLRYYTRCPIPGKPPEWKEHTATLTQAQYNQVVDYCQQTYRSFNSLPLWLILIIVFLVIAAVATTALLFWRYWLRKRLYPAEYGLASSMDSRFTSAISSSSSIGSSGPASSSALPKLSLRNSSHQSPSGLSTRRSSSPGSGTGSGVPSDYANPRVISLAPGSSRRASSRALSRAAASNPVTSANRSVGSISSQGSHKSHRSHSSRSRSGSRSDKKTGASASRVPSSSQPGSSSPSASQGVSSTLPTNLSSSPMAKPSSVRNQSTTATSTAMSRQL